MSPAAEVISCGGEWLRMHGWLEEGDQLELYFCDMLFFLSQVVSVHEDLNNVTECLSHHWCHRME
jgi:hypothetical protein